LLIPHCSSLAADGVMEEEQTFGIVVVLDCEQPRIIRAPEVLLLILEKTLRRSRRFIAGAAR
jgi:hypothetical protein